jgi:hypothetical protein
MVLDTLTNDTVLDLSGALATIIHPIVMVHDGSITYGYNVDSSTTFNPPDFDLIKGLSVMFC